MYGNPVADLQEIARLCGKNGILLIEDCASAMGAESPFYKLGSQGDFTIYSMGYSKTVDLGYGGLIVTRRDVEPLRNEEKKLPLYTGDSLELELFSKVYRTLRNHKGNTAFEKAIYSVLPNAARNELLCRIEDGQRAYLQKGCPVALLYACRSRKEKRDHFRMSAKRLAGQRLVSESNARFRR